MKPKAKRVGLYLRVSTDGQTTENQSLELERVAEARGWIVKEIYLDQGISGAKGRDKRPALDRMLKDVVRGKLDIIAAWSVDRLGRSLVDLVTLLSEIHGANADLYLHQQAIDTTTPAGKAMFQMLGVFAEFERSMIRDRVKAGLARAVANGVRLGRPEVDPERLLEARLMLSGGTGIGKVARTLGIGTGRVHRLRREMTADADAA